MAGAGRLRCYFDKPGAGDAADVLVENDGVSASLTGRPACC